MENKEEKKNVLIYMLFIFIIGIFGGIVGSYSYLDYKLENKGVIETTKNINVNENSATIEAVKSVSPAVVSITATQQTFDFFGNVSNSESAGTGFIVTEDGLILTNKHVVSNSKAEYSVYTSEGKKYKAEIKATDPLNDIAFIKIDAAKLPVATLGNSESLQIGQTVIAIGNALGQYQNTVTQGVVSALGRAIEAGDVSGGTVETLDNVIQTDAAINSGNSGGPLINLEGQVVGINTAVASNANSIGFAIPVNLAKTDLDSVISKGRVIRPMLGVRYIPITKELAISNNLPASEGAYIYGGRNQESVVAGSPAAKAGLKEGDIIIKINSDKITSKQSLASILSKYQVGDEVTITYIRDKKEQSVKAELQESK